MKMHERYKRRNFTIRKCDDIKCRYNVLERRTYMDGVKLRLVKDKALPKLRRLFATPEPIDPFEKIDPDKTSKTQKGTPLYLKYLDTEAQKDRDMYQLERRIIKSNMLCLCVTPDEANGVNPSENEMDTMQDLQTEYEGIIQKSVYANIRKKCPTDMSEVDLALASRDIRMNGTEYISK
jgi:hypothetical protein